MRRILRKIASSDYGNFGDTSTLAEPEVVNKIADHHKKLTQMKWKSTSMTKDGLQTTIRLI